MRCPRCQHDNDATASFCEECGTGLGARSCAACNATLKGSAKFCPSCGARVHALTGTTTVRDLRAYTPKHLADKILQSKSALEGERKQVTVLFADVKGSMELAEKLDPEEWHRILDRFFAILTDGVHRFEGTVNQYTGDGIMALFGAPIAHEDHAQRACYAALHLQDELRRYADELRLERGLNFSVRMGLNSGEVVVGKIGDDLRMDYTAQGHTVGLAARMGQVAEAGRVYLTGHTARLVEGFFRLRDLGATQVKGVEGGVHVYELEAIGALRTRFEVARRRGLSRFVGRGDEMATLEAALARALEGQGQVVGVVGEAGVGKSRLCFEFVERCRARGVPVYEGHGVSHGKVVPWLPVLELLRAYFGIGEQDDERTAREKMAGRMLLLDRSLEEALPLLFDFLGVPDPERPAPRLDPDARQQRLFEAVRRLTHARGRREPAVFLVEDLHWIDGASEAFLENVVEALPGSRTLLLVNFRPEYQPGWSKKSYYQQLPLLPLGAQAVRELLLGLLGPDPSLADLGDRIHSHTSGNPFFVEESVRSLLEAGVLAGAAGAYRLVEPIAELAIPPTVQAVLAARIDRLAERQKQVLQTASVIGKTFSEPVLQRVAGLPARDLGEALHELVGAEFLYEEALYPEAAYAFTHPLTQEVAYGSQLKDRRRCVHGAVARALETLHGNRLDERAALLAHHWEGAEEPLLAARWHRRAATWAGVSHAAEALRHWQRVRCLLDGVPESTETIAFALEARTNLLRLAAWAGTLDEDRARLFAEGAALAARSGDPRSEVLLLSTYGWCQVFVGEIREGVDALRRAKGLADALSDPALRVGIRLFLNVGLAFSGPLAEALATTEEILALQKMDTHLGGDFVGYDPAAVGLALHGRALVMLGQVADGTDELRGALDLARRGGDLEALYAVEIYYTWAAVVAGDETTALTHASRTVEAAERLGTAADLGPAYGIRGYALVLAEQWSEAVEALERSLARGAGYERLGCTPPLALAWLGLGDAGRARSLAGEAVSLTRRAGASVFEIYAQLALARTLVQTEGAKGRGEVEQALARAHALVEQTGARMLKPQVHVERAGLARALGDQVGRERELREAHRLFTEMGATGHAARVAKELRNASRISSTSRI